MEKAIQGVLIELAGVSRRGESTVPVACDIGSISKENYSQVVREIAIRSLAGQQSAEILAALGRRRGLRPTRGLQRTIKIITRRVREAAT